MIYGASAFSRVADLPFALDWVQSELAENLAMPTLAGVSATEPLRFVHTVDPALPLSADNPANVALIPLIDSGEAAQAAFAAAYSAREAQGSFTLFSNPANTNLPQKVATAVEGHTLFTSVSADALHWAWKNRDNLLGAPQQSLPGTFRVLVNPQRLSALLEARGGLKAGLFRADRLARDFETLSFSFTFESTALALSLRGVPKKDSVLDVLTASWQKPEEKLWNGLPANAFLTFLASCGKPALWNTYLGESLSPLLQPAAGLLPQSAFSAERLMYLASTRDRTGLCFVQVTPLTNAAPVRVALAKLHASGITNDLTLVKKPPRHTSGGLAVETYGINLSPSAKPAGAKASEPSALVTLLSLFLKKAVLEAAVAGSNLVTVIGPAGAIDEELANLSFADRPMTLDRSIRIQDAAQAAMPYLAYGGDLHLSALLRHIVSIIPEIKPETVRKFPLGGDGATFGLSRSDDRTVTASARFQANEIAALQRINRDGREVLQELFFQMFAKQMMDVKQPQEPPVRENRP